MEAILSRSPCAWTNVVAMDSSSNSVLTGCGSSTSGEINNLDIQAVLSWHLVVENSTRNKKH